MKSPLKKKRRTWISIYEKIGAAQMLNEGQGNLSVQPKFNFLERIVRSDSRNIHSFTQRENSDHASFDLKSVRYNLFPAIDEALVNFFSVARASEMFISFSVLQAQEIRIGDKCLQGKRS